MDLDNDYYSSRCKDINGLCLFEGTCMTFVGGDSHHHTLFYFNIEELFTVLGWTCSYTGFRIITLFIQVQMQVQKQPPNLWYNK